MKSSSSDIVLEGGMVDYQWRSTCNFFTRICKNRGSEVDRILITTVRFWAVMGIRKRWQG
jgi:hypothetical protein